MKMIFAVQVLIILSFLFSLRMRVWRTSLNSFIFITGLFILTITREIPYFKDIWVPYHTGLIGLVLLFVMVRLSYQSLHKKYKDIFHIHNRRSTDAK